MQMAVVPSSLASTSRTPRIAALPRLTPSRTVFASFLHLQTTKLKNHHLMFNPIAKPSPLRTFLPIKPKPKPTLPLRCNATPQCLFTGIVEEMGTVKQLGMASHGGFDMKIEAKTVLDGVKLGDSIAVNGTCLTVTEFDGSSFTVGLSPETLRKTSLAELESGSLVNLERAVMPTSRMGGHFVQGHVDGTGVIVSKVPEGDSLWVKVKVEKELLRYVVPKGYIAVDGTSLTVVDVFDDEGCFNFMLVAYTQRKVVIPLKEVGQKVNLEVDILGKQVERLLRSGIVDSKVYHVQSMGEKNPRTSSLNQCCTGHSVAPFAKVTFRHPHFGFYFGMVVSLNLFLSSVQNCFWLFRLFSSWLMNLVWDPMANVMKSKERSDVLYHLYSWIKG